MSDLIDRQQAIDALAKQMPHSYTPDGSHPADEEIFMAQEIYADCITTIEILPSAQPDLSGYSGRLWKAAYERGKAEAQSEPKEIGYGECANAMLKMWIDNVLTGSEYMRIMDKLNKHWMKEGEKPCD